CINSGLQIDNQVRLGHRLVQQVVQTVVNHQFRIVQGQIGEDFVLREGVVGQNQLGEEVALRDRALLVVSRKQKKELAAERRAAFVLVEIVEEGVVDILENLRAAETLREKRDQRCLADADWSFDRDVAPGERIHV